MKARHGTFLSALAMAALLAGGQALADEPRNLPAGSHHAGDLSSRNNAITVGDDSRVDGVISTRNGRIQLGDKVTAGNIDSRNGPIRIGRDAQLGDVEARNGTINLGRGSQAGAIEARNGAIRLEGGNQVGALDSRNGSLILGANSVIGGRAQTRNGTIEADENVEVQGDVTTRNGLVRFREGGQVAGGITSRNGAIQLSATRVGGNISAVSGDITLEDGSEVGGNVAINLSEAGSRQGGWFGFGGSKRFPDAGSIHITGGSHVKGHVELLLPEDYDGEIPRVVVDADSRIDGQLTVDSRVELVIDDEGRIGGIVRE